MFIYLFCFLRLEGRDLVVRLEDNGVGRRLGVEEEEVERDGEPDW